jgi:uncharacterized membrane protein YkoI
MSPATLILASVLTAAGLVGPALAADQAECLTLDQRRAALSSGQVVTLSKAMRAAKARKTEVVNARLCRGPNGLVYLLTVVARDGKVSRKTVDAQTGKLVEGG